MPKFNPGYLSLLKLFLAQKWGVCGSACFCMSGISRSLISCTTKPILFCLSRKSGLVFGADLQVPGPLLIATSFCDYREQKASFLFNVRQQTRYSVENKPYCKNLSISILCAGRKALPDRQGSSAVSSPDTRLGYKGSCWIPIVHQYTEYITLIYPHKFIKRTHAICLW